MVSKARARLTRLLAPLCLGATLLGLTAAACSVPEFGFDAPTSIGDGGGDGGSVVPHCRNGELEPDLGESDFDCGRGCSPCSAGKHCSDVADCQDGLLCHDGSCLEAGCMNGAQDGNETDVDCGGDGCKACLTSQTCGEGSDCEGLVCEGGKCQDPGCTDQVQNGRETSVDCGGDCDPCPADEPCVAGKDCISGECNGKVCGTQCADGLANCDKENGNGCEINTRTDLENCGSCGFACDLPHAAAECSAGECRIKTDGCDLGYMDCNGDPADGCEVDLKTNKLNCGSCHNVCPDLNGTPSCEAGMCQITCNDGFEDCDDTRDNGCEINLKTSSQNCNECSKKCAADPGYSPYCKDGTCGQTQCSAGKGDCNGDPADACETTLTSDVDNCGGCGIKCEAVNANVACVNSKCVISSCKGKFADCGGGYPDGCETNTDISTTHCGGCGKACTVANGSPKCDSGSCEVNSCGGTFRDCDGDPKNGCEINIATNAKSCGGCGAEGSDCTTKYANASSTCMTGACTAPSCNTGFGNCDGDASDGCEATLGTDKNNCGSCGTACAQGSAGHVSMNECAGGQCNPMCSSSYQSCDGNKVNGCESDSLTDESNCGVCGTACLQGSAGHVSSNDCSNGACDPVCSGTYRDCDSSRSNGCEVDSATNASNCGGCGNKCDTSAAAHVTSNACSGSSCQPKCNGLYRDCDTSRLNGCEKDVSTDKNNCGGCGTVCGTTNASATSCSAGACSPTCNTGWGKCATPEQGCVTPLGTVTNCASCGQACTGSTPFCGGSGCVAFRAIEKVGPALSAVGGWGGNTSDVGELKLSHTLVTPRTDALGNANNRMILVGVTATDNYTAMENIAVSYAGVAMKVGFKQLDPDKHSFAGIYYLLEANLPEAGANKQVVATFGTAFSWGHGGVDVVELKNVMQVAPIAANGAGVTGNCSPVANRSASVNFSQAGSFVYGIVGSRHATKVVLTDVDATQISNRFQATPDGMSLGSAFAIDDGNHTMGWDVTDCYNSAISLVAVKRLSAN